MGRARPPVTGGRLRFLDHTADVGLEITAPTLDVLFDTAGRGLMALLQGRDDDSAEPSPRDPVAAEVMEVTLTAEDGVRLLADWLKELLYLHEVRHRDYVEMDVRHLHTERLEARVTTAPAAPPVREIKGVTYHQLALESVGPGWKARVIFDV